MQMRLSILLLLSVLSVCSFASEVCKLRQELHRGWQKWKKAQIYSYTYMLYVPPEEGTYYTETVVEVVDNKVVKVTFYEKYTDDSSANTVTVLSNYSGSTMEQLYKRCKNTYLRRNPRSHVFTLSIEDNGVLTACGTDPDPPVGEGQYDGWKMSEFTLKP